MTDNLDNDSFREDIEPDKVKEMQDLSGRKGKEYLWQEA